MDLNELLSFKPKLGKHSLDDPVEDGRAAKTLREDNGLSEEEKALLLLQNMDDDEVEQDEELDGGAVKRMLLSLEKKVLRNQEMRIKFPDQPEKFMESELELNDELQRLHILSTVPEHYSVLVETSVLATLLGLLNHDNTDISLSVVDLIQELTDLESLDEESHDQAEALVDALLEQQLLALLVGNLERLNEKVKEESDGVYNSLSIIENMCEVRNKEVCTAAGQQGMLSWLLKRVRIRTYDPNKLYASEILAILLQGHEANQKLLGEMNGIDTLLQSLAYYKRRDPGAPDEIELMENLFDCLCASLMYIPNRDRFLKGEGLQLMILMLKEKKMSRNSALKVLNYAMSTSAGADNCAKFIEVYGLRSLFPCFMRTPKSSRKAGTSKSDHEEHVCCVIAALLMNVTGSGRDRLIAKFSEKDFEKVDRLMELHFSYSAKMADAGEEDTEEAYLQRLDNGLYTLQMVDYVIAELFLCGISEVKSRIDRLLAVRGVDIAAVKDVLKDYAQSQDGAKEKQRILELVGKLSTSDS